MGKDINTFHLINHKISFDDRKFGSREVYDELAIITPVENILSLATLNGAQQHAYYSILQKVFSFESAAFFIDGLSGTRKIFLYKTFLLQSI